MTGRIADGAMLQIADPDLIRWFVGQVRDSAREAGRDPDAVQIMAAAPAHVGDLADGRDRIRWFPALVGNHVVDLVNKYPGELPEALTRYVRDREGYDYLHHAEVGSSNAAFVTDEVVDRFGDRRRRVDAHIAKLRELAEAGVDQFNLYLMNGDEEEQLEIYGREIIPRSLAADAPRPQAACMEEFDAHAHHQRHDRHRRRLVRGRRPRRRRDDRPRWGADLAAAGVTADETIDATGKYVDPGRHRRPHAHGAAVRRHLRQGHLRDRDAGGRLRRHDDDRRLRRPVEGAARSARASTPGRPRPRATPSSTTAST